VQRLNDRNNVELSRDQVDIHESNIRHVAVESYGLSGLLRSSNPFGNLSVYGWSTRYFQSNFRLSGDVTRWRSTSR
jgi:hypothetical protein